MFFSRNISRRSPWALMLIASALFMVACDEETTVTETTDPPQAEVTSETPTSPETETTAGTDLPSGSTTTASEPPTARPNRKAVPTSSEVKAKAEAEAQAQAETAIAQTEVAPSVTPEASNEEDDIPEWIKWQSPVIEEGTLYWDETTKTDFDRYPKVDNTKLSEFEMVRYEAIGSLLYEEGGEERLEFLMGYCYQSHCREVYHTNPYQAAANEFEQEWKVEVIGLEQFADKPAVWDVRPAATSVLCSTARPLVVDFDGEEYILHHISAGSPAVHPSGNLFERARLYWKVCHGKDTLASHEVPEFAANLGYDLNTETKIVQQAFIELIEP